MNSELYYENKTATSRNISTIDSCNISKYQKENLIKYLENEINDLQNKLDKCKNKLNDVNILVLQTCIECYQDILERIKSGKYE